MFMDEQLHAIIQLFFFKMGVLPLKRQSQLQQTTNFEKSFPILERNKERYLMRIVCQQTIIM